MSEQPGRSVRCEREGAAFSFGSAGSRITVSVCSPRIVRVELEVDGDETGPSYVGSRDWPATHVEVIDGEPVRLSTTDLSVDVATDPVRVTLLDGAGSWLLREPVDGGMSAQRIGDGASRHRVRACFAFSGEQHFYGLGQGGREIDRLGIARQLWNTQLGHGPGSDMGVPLLLSSRGYGLLLRQY